MSLFYTFVTYQDRASIHFLYNSQTHFFRKYECSHIIFLLQTPKAFFFAQKMKTFKSCNSHEVPYSLASATSPASSHMCTSPTLPSSQLPECINPSQFCSFSRTLSSLFLVNLSKYFVLQISAEIQFLWGNLPWVSDWAGCLCYSILLCPVPFYIAVISLLTEWIFCLNICLKVITHKEHN